ncbi:MAG: hypothetical protein ACI9FB_002196 [Candidatus Azotimanducaceae bacterium]|jgi:hypothetical protein
MDKKKQLSEKNQVSQFLTTLAKTPVVNRNRLIFSLDATASRAPTWDNASHLQAQMFQETSSLGGLAIQLCYYRGFMEFYRSPWHFETATLMKEMTSVNCLGGHTQIAKILRHALSENLINRIHALVFIGDAVEEDVDDICNLAGKLGLMNVPIFIFHEGRDRHAEAIFQQLASLSGGAYAPFDLASASQLKSLLTAVAVFAAGGKKAFDKLKHSPAVALLSQQLKR